MVVSDMLRISFPASNGAAVNMRAVLVIGHVAVADLEHVGISPMTRAGVRSRRRLLVDVIQHAVPLVADIAGGAPQIAAYLRSPLLHAAQSVFAKAEHDGSLGAFQSLSHLLIDRLKLFVFVDRTGAAPVVLQVIDAPGRVHLGVLLFIPVAARITAAGAWPRRRIDSDLQALGVHVVGERLHVGELLVR